MTLLALTSNFLRERVWRVSPSTWSWRLVTDSYLLVINFPLIRHDYNLKRYSFSRGGRHYAAALFFMRRNILLILFNFCKILLFQVRTLFVSGLPMDTKPRELYLLFRAYEVTRGIQKEHYTLHVGHTGHQSRSGSLSPS